jgi:hypothetical protein
MYETRVVDRDPDWIRIMGQKNEDTVRMIFYRKYRNVQNSSIYDF